MARFIFPHGNHLGNLVWTKNEKPSQVTINKALAFFGSRNYFASAFPEGDGICFEHSYKKNIDFFRDFTDAFPDLDFQIYDTPENRKLMLQINIPPAPKPGNFYYKTCNKKIKQVNGKEEITFSGPDVVTGNLYSVTISKEQLDLIEKGLPFEIVLNHLPANKREFLISGISTNDLFKDNDDF